MCYEFWRHEQMKSDEAEAKKRAQEILDKAKVGKPIPPPAPVPVTAEREEDTVAA